MENYKLPILYKYDTNGKLRHWTAEISDKGYRAIYGQLDGKTTMSKWYYTTSTNDGKANARNPAQQAEFEARALWNKKIDSGFSQWVDSLEVTRDDISSPMLATSWEKRKNKISFPVYSQPKLDGMRAIISKDGGKSRNGKEWKTIPHIHEYLRVFFDEHPNIVLDGELYNHDYKDNFNKISSLAKKTKPSLLDLEESRYSLQYWIYDCYSLSDSFLSYENRLKILTDKLANIIYKAHGISIIDYIKVVPTAYITSIEELDSMYEDYIEDGFEGQMIRLPNSSYESKRSNNLIKRKEFQDSEYKIISIEEGNGNKRGMAGYMFLEREDGIKFRSNIKGSHEYLRELYSVRDTMVGKYATVKYFNLTPEGIPRFPYVIKIREGIGVD